MVRLELIKLVHRHDKHPNDIIRDAHIYEQYVVSKEMANKDVPKEDLKSPEKKKGFFGSKSKDDNQ